MEATDLGHTPADVGSPAAPLRGGLHADDAHHLPWPDAVLDTVGHDPRSRYAERFWLPTLGPTALLLLRHLAAQFDLHPAGIELRVADTSSRSASVSARGRAHRSSARSRGWRRSSSRAATGAARWRSAATCRRRTAVTCAGCRPTCRPSTPRGPKRVSPRHRWPMPAGARGASALVLARAARRPRARQPRRGRARARRDRLPPRGVPRRRDVGMGAPPWDGRPAGARNVARMSPAAADDLDRIAGWLTGAQQIVVLTGAGISTESGIPDFRGPNGVWTKNPAAEKTATLSYYVSDPDVRKQAWQNRVSSEMWHAEPNVGPPRAGRPRAQGGAAHARHPERRRPPPGGRDVAGADRRDPRHRPRREVPGLRMARTDGPGPRPRARR